jgi:hypothetical protein
MRGLSSPDGILALSVYGSTGLFFFHFRKFAACAWLALPALRKYWLVFLPLP